MKKYVMTALALAMSISAFAQPKPEEPPPRWLQGRSAEDAQSTLHPFVPKLTGADASELQMSKLKLPPGFAVDIWAEVPNARSLARGTKGTIFVSNLAANDVYAVVDKNGKREVKKILKGLNAPNGIAFLDGNLYVAERTQIKKYENIEDRLDNPPEGVLVVDGLDPTNGPGHFWKYLTVGPDKKLYFNIGSPQNITIPNYVQGAIMRVDPQTGRLERVATGVRNSVGMTFHPVTKKLWFTEHGRDWMGDDKPSDELNVLSKEGENFGYPFCHQGDIPDPLYGKYASCDQFTPPALNLGAHVAPLGLRFYTGNQFPAEYKNALFVARHGSWNRNTKQGYDVMRVTLGANGKVVKYEPFLTGFLLDEKGDPPMWGRPVDVLVMPDGSMLVSDDYNGVIYRVTYNKSASGASKQ
jgi:glucose/arabinose dehydrogenase